MFIPPCLFCDHTNPADAKYCNECGSPLHLKLCKQCEAINDMAAETCHKCGTAFAARLITADAVAVTAGADSIATLTPGDVGFVRERPSRVEIAESQDARVRRPGSEATASDADADGRAVACASQSSNTDGRSSLCETCDTTPAVISQILGTTAKPRRKFRVAMATLMPAVLLSGVAVLAYYAYRHPVQLSEQVSLPSTVPQPSAIETSAETIVEPKPELASTPERAPAKPPKSVKSARERRPTRAEHVAVPPAQERATPAPEAPEPNPVPSTVAPAPAPPPSLDQQLARCDHGSVFERVLCDQRVRIAYCEGRWGRVPECPSGRVADYGQ